MAGVNRHTGQLLSGLEHVLQSMAVIFTTPRGARVLRRHVGSDLPRLVDAPISPATLIDFYAATAEAVALFEPRFRISRMRAEIGDTPGHLNMVAEGVYFPRGHLGDFTVSENQVANIPI